MRRSRGIRHKGSGLRFYRNEEGVLEAVMNGEPVSDIYLVLTFPVTEPERYISVRTASHQEIHLIHSLSELDISSQAAVREDLERRYMIPKVVAIKMIKRQGNHWLWDVETSYGKVAFRTNQPQENIDILSNETYIIRDTDGRRFALHVSRLDKRSKLFWNKII
ncbi:hypothetical protein BK142_12270 [Paenibacillus glucanolyticus]|nr:hypothetical protein BK142_12270 [Paenibacillus glucanolyticus]